MNAFFVAAAGLCVVGGFLHSVLGERLGIADVQMDIRLLGYQLAKWAAEWVLAAIAKAEK